MRESIRQFVRVCAGILPVKEPIYEFGSYQVPGQEELADLRPFFPGKRYVGADMRPGPGVDVVLNLHQIDLPAASVGTVLILDTLEHVEYVRTAVNELHRIIAPGGLLIMSSVLNFPIHGCPHDYWRFTPEAFRSLLQPFEHAYVDFAGDPVLPRTILGVGFKGDVAPEVMVAFTQQMEAWKVRFDDKPKGVLKQFKELFVPPILRLAWRKVRELIS